MSSKDTGNNHWLQYRVPLTCCIEYQHLLFLAQALCGTRAVCNTGTRAGSGTQRECCRLVKSRVYYRMSNFKYGASCTDVMYTKLEHPTNNLKDTRLFAGKLRIGKLKIFINVKNNFIGCLAWLLVSWPTLIHLQVFARRRYINQRF